MMRRHKTLLPAVIMALTLVLAFAGMAYAVTLPETDPGWEVTFTDEDEMESNFGTSDLDETISGMQPGDEAHFKISVSNDNSESTDWYMENEIVYSMEDRSANSGTAGGAYTYRLSYTDADGNETVYFDSEAAGGDDTSEAEGLHKATGGQEGWFYLGEIGSGSDGTVDLVVALDGETQGNNYQDTLADLELRFAAEIAERSENTKTYKKTTGSSVNTGDDTNIRPYAVICFAAGLMLLAAAIYSVVLRRREGRDEN